MTERVETENTQIIYAQSPFLDDHTIIRSEYENRCHYSAVFCVWGFRYATRC